MATIAFSGQRYFEYQIEEAKKLEEEKKAWALIDAGYDGSFTGPA